MKEIVLVAMVGGSAMLLSWLGTAIQTHEQAAQIESNKEFNALLIEEVKMQRAEDASH
jgi:hypothetical protein